MSKQLSFSFRFISLFLSEFLDLSSIAFNFWVARGIWDFDLSFYSCSMNSMSFYVYESFAAKQFSWCTHDYWCCHTWFSLCIRGILSVNLYNKTKTRYRTCILLAKIFLTDAQFWDWDVLIILCDWAACRNLEGNFS